MEKAEAIKLVEEALHRMKHEPQNCKGTGWQCGGAYWRLAQAIRNYLEPILEEQEGKAHADFILETHGRVVVPETEERASND